jgi:hypothetical protein
MPPRPRLARLSWPAAGLPIAGLVAATLILPAAARAADAGLDLAADRLTLDAPGAATSQVLLALDRPTTPVAVQQVVPARSAGGPGFNPADVDAASFSSGLIVQTGIASYYGAHWAGRRTASGSRYNPEAMTAASHTLPLGTRVLVTLEGTARSVLVTITDHQGTAQRIIDLSRAAARKLGLLGRGTGRVVLTRA